MTVHTGQSVEVTVRYFAAAQAAAGCASEHLAVGAGTTINDLVDGLAVRSADLARVLLRCSYLRDGVAVRDKTHELQPGAVIDVLPPFAGG